jgi:DNA-binding CsgD family transcriptional regulator
MTDESQISEREREILRLVATGATNQQIAQQLNISINTVKVHLRNIFGKIGVVSRTEATLYAVRSGLVSVERAGGATAVADEPDEPRAERSALGAVPLTTPEIVPAPPAAVDEPAPPLVQAAPPAATEPAPLLAPATLPAAATEPSAPGPQPSAKRLQPASFALHPSTIALALLLVGGLIAFVLFRQQAPAVSPTAQPGPALPAAGERWRALAPMPQPRAGHALAPVTLNGSSYLFAIGGQGPAGVSGDVLRYDIASDSWARYTAKSTPVADVSAVVIGGKIYVPGGRTADGSISPALEVYDPQSDTWDELAPMPAPRSRYGLAAVEGKLYLFGGWDGADYAADVWQYTPDTNAWAELTPMPAPRADAAAAVLDEQVFLIGGENAGGALTRNERYSPAAEGQGSPWTVRAPLPEPRSSLAAAAAAGRIFAFGGPRGALAYNSARDSWEPVELPAELELSDLRAQFLGDGRIYLVGGSGPQGLSAGAYEYLALFVVTIPVTSN